jgi:hypothetical protein
MSNEEVMEAVRQMATNAMAQAATKAATTEVLGRAVTSNQEQENEEIVLPIIEVTKPKLSVERQIQEHYEVVVEKEDPEFVEVVIINVQLTMTTTSTPKKKRELLTKLFFGVALLVVGVAVLVLGVYPQLKYQAAKMKTSPENVIMEPSFLLPIAAQISIGISLARCFK